MNWKTVIISVSMGALLFYSSCQQSLTPTDSEESPETGITDEKSVGIKLENPYTVETMLRAFNNLKSEGAIVSSLTNDEFKPTHYYIRFKPETEEEYMEINQNSGLVLWDFPLDYKFPEGMVKYRDPEIPEDNPNYLYTAVKVNQDLISDNYEILAELILLPEDDEEVQGKRSDSYNSELFDNYALLEHEALRITGNLPESPKRGKWRPRGRISVYDNVRDSFKDIASVNIRTKNWFKWWSGYTDNSGVFRCPKEYYGKVSYSIRWQYPHNRFDIRNGDRGQAYFHGPDKSNDSWKCRIRTGKSFMYGHIFRAGSFYVGQEPFGLNNRPFDYISIKAMDKNSPNDHHAIHDVRYSDITIFRNNSSGGRYSSRQLFFLTIHELGHAHHEEIYNGYKLRGVTSEIKEAWACAVGYFMTSKAYYLPVNKFKYFWYSRQNWSSWKNNGKNSPMMIDLVDEYNQRSMDSDYLEDPISGYTLKQIESVIRKRNCKTINDFKKEIKRFRKPRNVTNSMLDRYFSQYKK